MPGDALAAVTLPPAVARLGERALHASNARAVDQRPDQRAGVARDRRP